MPHICIDSEMYELTNDHYDLGALLEALNKDNVSAKPEDYHNITAIEYFIRTTQGNRVVASAEENMTVFKYDDRDFKNYKEATLNDLVLLLARDTLRYVFKEDLAVIGVNSCPTPFGMRLNSKDSKGVALAFQIVVDDNYLSTFHSNYEYKVVTAQTELHNVQEIIHKQFKYTAN